MTARRARKPPAELYAQAAAEYPRQPISRRRRYRELLREEGHLIPSVPPTGAAALPCGWVPPKGSNR